MLLSNAINDDHASEMNSHNVIEVVAKLKSKYGKNRIELNEKDNEKKERTHTVGERQSSYTLG